MGFRRNTLRVISLRAFVFLLFGHGLLWLRVVSCCVSLTADVAAVTHRGCAAGKNAATSLGLRRSGAKERSAPALAGRKRQEKGAAIRCRSGGPREEVQRERRTERDSVRVATPAQPAARPGGLSVLSFFKQ